MSIYYIGLGSRIVLVYTLHFGKLLTNMFLYIFMGSKQNLVSHTSRPEYISTISICFVN